MELREFISTSLKEIILAVHDVQNDIDVKDSKGLINPICYGDTAKLRHIDTNDDRLYIEEIEFDVAVTATSGKETKGGIAVFGGALALGSQGKSDSASGVVSRLRFSIPIAMPVSHPS